MKCLHCGFELGEGDVFCPRCGEKVGQAPPTAAPEAPGQSAPVKPASEQSTPELSGEDAPEDLPVEVHVPEGKTDPEIARAREEFIKEFVATAPNMDRPRGKKRKPGKVLLTLDIILCTIVEILLIGDILVSVFDIGPAMWHFSPIYSVSALICVALLEVVLILVVSVIRRKRHNAPAKASVPVAVQAATPVKSGTVSEAALKQAAPAEAEAGQALPVQTIPAPVSRGETSPQAVSVQAAPVKPAYEIPAAASGCVMVFILGGQEKKVIFNEFPVVIGRDTIKDDTVSLVHCAVNLENGVMKIRDLESANGVYVNGVRIDSPTEIQWDDRIIIGRAMVTFRMV